MTESPTESSRHTPTLLLLLTPSHSGSTAMAQFMAQANDIAGLQARFEGQWLVRHLSESDRWDPSKQCNYDELRSRWHETALAIQRGQPEIQYILEKSPPNLVRHKAIRGLFEQSRVVVNNRNPYAQISSIAHRRVELATLSEPERRQLVASLANRWLWTAEHLRKILEEERYPFLSYEQFCEDPSSLFRAFGFDARLSNVDSGYAVKVKDYSPQEVINMNNRQIEKLDTKDVDIIFNVLHEQASVVNYFGYNLRPSCAGGCP